MRAARRQARRGAIGRLARTLGRVDRLATRLRRQFQALADDAVALEAAIGRAVTTLRRLQPSPRRRARR